MQRGSDEDGAHFRQAPGFVEDQRIAFIMASMDPNDIPDDFEQANVERSRESIMFEADMLAAIAASRTGFER